MSSDIKLNGSAVVVEGNLEMSGSAIIPKGSLAIGTANPVRPMHVESGEIHSGGPGGGFSFSDRAKPAFVGGPQNGERWVWYAHQEAARLWSGGDVMVVKPMNKSWVTELKGRLRVEMSVEVDGTMRANRLQGNVQMLSGMEDKPGGPRMIKLFTSALQMHGGLTNAPDHIALWHEFDKASQRDALVINHQGGYKGGVRVDGNLQVNGVVTQSSSIALKDGVAPLSLDAALSALQQLRAVTFSYKADERRERHAGFIAEEVPELVAKGERKSVGAMDVVAVLTTVVKQLHETVAALGAKVDALKQEGSR